MKYVSTRGLAPQVNSTEALLNGIAPDGGLYVPAELPEKIFATPPARNYAETMSRLLEIFFDDIPAPVRNNAIERSVARFSAPEVVPLKPVGGDNVWFLELFHGPTCAFKDVALTILPPLLQYAAEKSAKGRVAILTATSGDTGSAAMSGFANVVGTEVLVFYPQTGTSEIQRRQMVCCGGNNVGACAIEGNFDDAQAGVKAVFADADFRRAAAEKGVFLSSANSINVGRLFPQVCYYLDAWRKLAEAGALATNGVFDVVVPTGNFGNILAANFAKRLGAPIRRLIAASNENRVIADFIATGTYDRRREFKITNSPSMDILVSSNAERLLFYVLGRNSAQLRERMDALKNVGTFSLTTTELAALQSLYRSGFATISETEAAIRELCESTGYLADPHTAIGWKVLRDQADRDNAPAIVAATASPWKFPGTIRKALGEQVCDNDFDNLRALATRFGNVPEHLASLEPATIQHKLSCAKNKIAETVRAFFKI
ncbi:MAG: threonine synthase [Opitutae bacterium]|nr:threonine synthase [Opitutae bacterium]